jgi:hypothetical protein
MMPIRMSCANSLQPTQNPNAASRVAAITTAPTDGQGLDRGEFDVAAVRIDGTLCGW